MGRLKKKQDVYVPDPIKVLAVDPSLRSTGLAVITYDRKKDVEDPKAYQITSCQVLVNPAKFTGTDAIMNMLDMITEEAKKTCYSECKANVIESPGAMFNKAWGAGTVCAISHISGGSIIIFGLQKSYIFRPNEWNRNRNKSITHANTIDFIGSPDTWDYENPLKHEKYFEHVLDAASMGIWWIKNTQKHG